MRLFSLFKAKTKNTFNTDFGVFELIQENFWLCEDKNLKICYYVNGDNEKPFQNEIEFLKKLDKEIERLDDDINTKIIALYRELNLPIYFNYWRERLRIDSYQVFTLNECEFDWSFTLLNDNPYDDDGIIYFEFFVKNQEIKEIIPNA